MPMKKLLISLAISTLAAPALAATLVHNVTGYTLGGNQLMQFVAMEYDAGKVTHLYASPQEAAASKAQERIDGGGATLLPGLIDAHGHVGNLGYALNAVNLVGVASEADAVQRVKRFVAARPGDDWLLGRGWNQVLWPDKSFPTSASLDALGDRPIALVRVDGHAMWLNTAGLKAAGITDATADPEGGQILRDAQGKATGILVDNAMYAVEKVLPAPTDEKNAEVLLQALEVLSSLGLTSAHDAFTSARDVRSLQSLQQRDALPIRFYGMLDVLDAGNDQYLAKGPMLDPEHMLDIRSVKISSDGALGSRGAALFKDYSDSPGHRGLLLLSDEQLEHHIRRAMQAGYQVNTHAIGDRANGKILDFYEQLITETDSRKLRHRIEHAQILSPADLPRLAKAGIIASIQPLHATSDKNMAGDRLGEERLQGAYAWKQLLDSGARLAGGSDFPVEPANPFFGLHAAVTRQSQDDQPPGGWLPDEKVSREVALHMFTVGAAYAAHQEQVVGSLLPGFAADFVLLRDDYFQVPAKDIWKNKVLATYVAGKRVYAAE
jgi:predicted amidohydrolase YtcJ